MDDALMNGLARFLVTREKGRAAFTFIYNSRLRKAIADYLFHPKVKINLVDVEYVSKTGQVTGKEHQYVSAEAAAEALTETEALHTTEDSIQQVLDPLGDRQRTATPPLTNETELVPDNRMFTEKE